LMMGPEKFEVGTVAGDNFDLLWADNELGGKCRQLRVALNVGETAFENMVTRLVDIDDGKHLKRGNVEFIRTFTAAGGESRVVKDNAMSAAQMSVRCSRTALVHARV
jgi:hypothetical protein